LSLSHIETNAKYLLGRSILHGDPLRIELQIRRTPDYGNTGESVRIMKVTIKDLFGESERTVEVLADYVKFFEEGWVWWRYARAIFWRVGRKGGARIEGE